LRTLEDFITRFAAPDAAVIFPPCCKKQFPVVNNRNGT
jgi:hypothetical protein